MNALAKMFEPSKDRLISNAKRMMETAQDPEFKTIWQKDAQPIQQNQNSYSEL